MYNSEWMLFPTIFIFNIKSNFYHFPRISSQCVLAHWLALWINSVFLTLFSNDSYELMDGFFKPDIRTNQGKTQPYGQCLRLWFTFYRKVKQSVAESIPDRASDESEMFRIG